MIARLLINLKATKCAAMNMDGQTSQQSSAAVSDSADPLRFRGFIGSIGSVLTAGGFGEADAEDQDEPKGHPEETLSAPSQQPAFLEGEA